MNKRCLCFYSVVLKYSGTTRYIMNSEMLPGRRRRRRKKTQNKLTDTQTNKANISFFFPGDGSVGGKDLCCLNDISNNSSGKLKSISSHRVSIIPLLWLPRELSRWKTDRGLSHAPLAMLHIHLTSFQDTNVDPLEPGLLEHMQELTQDQRFKGKTLGGARGRE